MVTLFWPEKKLSQSFSYLKNPFNTTTLLIRSVFHGLKVLGGHINRVPLYMHFSKAKHLGCFKLTPQKQLFMKISDNANQAYMREVIQILSGDKVLRSEIRREKVGT